MGYTGRDCLRFRKANKNTPKNADLSPKDLFHKIHNVKEGDLRVQWQRSRKVSHLPQAGPSQTSFSPPSSNVKADNMQTLNSDDTPNSDDNDKPIDQPTNTINNLVSFSSLSSPILRDTISKLEEIFHTKTDSTAEPAQDTTLHSLAKGTQSAVAQSRASVHKVASSSNSGFLVKLNGKVVTAKPKPPTVPQT